MSDHRAGRKAPVRHWITPALFQGACGASSHDPGNAITGLPAEVTCPACRAKMPSGQVPLGYHPSLRSSSNGRRQEQRQ